MRLQTGDLRVLGIKDIRIIYSMKKKLLFVPFLIFALAGCNPVFNESSEEPTSSSESSSGAGSSESGGSSSEVGPHHHDISPDWSYDSNTHWHACSGCDEKFNEANHTFDGGTVIKEPTETEKGTRRYSCEVCDYHYDEDIDPLGPVIDDYVLMNEAIATKSFLDPYEARDYLKESGYNIGVNHATSKGTHYYYSDAHNKIVEYDPVNESVIRPTECASDYLTKYDSINVDTFGGLVGAFNDINNGIKDTSSIILTADIQQTSETMLAQYKAPNNIELDLNGHKIEASEEVNKPYAATKWYTLQFLDKTDTSKVYIHNGTIEANRKMEEDNVQDDSCCLSLVAAKSFRVSDISLKAYNATECIGDLSQYINANHHDNTKKVYLSNVDMTAPLKAMSIVGGEWSIEKCDVVGMVVIEGGRVSIDKCTIDASNLISGTYGTMLNYPHGFTNQQLVDEVSVTRLNGKDINTTVDEVLKKYYGSLTFNDAITIISRRSGAYSVPNVRITSCDLSPVVNPNNEEENRVTGYGIRLWDLENNSHDFIKVTIDENNTFPEEDGNGFGGMNLRDDQKIIIK